MEPVVKPETFRHLGEFDVSSLAELVSKLPDKLWEIEDERKENKFSVFHHTQHIIFRFCPGNQDPRNFYSTPIWSVWKNKLQPLLEKICEPYGYKNITFSKVMLARLLAGHEIDRHVDGAGSNLVTHKIHVPLQTNPKATFTIEEDTRHLQYGSAFEVNNIARHAAANLGEEHRIHLIFEFFEGSE